MFFPCEHGGVSLATLLLDAGADVAEKDGDERTPLHWAAVNGHQDIIALLASRKAPLGTSPLYDFLTISDVLDKDEKSPLAYACYQGHLTAAQELIARGATIDLLDKEGVSALHWASLQVCSACPNTI